VGTTGGAAVFDGQRWKPVSGLPSQTVFSIARQDGSLWFATLAGASRLEPASGAWQHYDLSQYGLGWAGVSDMAVDRAGKLWVTTIGDGVSFWDGKSWTTFRASNSSIPRNTATRLLLTDQGQIWVGFNYSAQPGGILARYDRSDWLAYTPSNSGYSGGEPTALALDARGQLWVGTAMNGLQIFQKAQDQ
jgi:streptogramin lyase